MQSSSFLFHYMCGFKILSCHSRSHQNNNIHTQDPHMSKRNSMLCSYLHVVILFNLSYQVVLSLTFQYVYICMVCVCLCAMASNRVIYHIQTYIPLRIYSEFLKPQSQDVCQTSPFTIWWYVTLSIFYFKIMHVYIIYTSTISGKLVPAMGSHQKTQESRQNI